MTILFLPRACQDQSQHDVMVTAAAEGDCGCSRNPFVMQTARRACHGCQSVI